MCNESIKFLIFVLDGMADLPCPELGGKTPLEAAQTDELDRLAKEGTLGRLQTVPVGCRAGSEVANLSILSYDPLTKNPGRGVLEAASMGLELREDMLVMRVNLVAFKGDLMVDHSSGHITSEEAGKIIHSLNLELGTSEMHIHPGVSYRHVLTIKGGSEKIACTPPHDFLEQQYTKYLPRAKSAEGEKTASLLRNLIRDSRKVLKDHPVNQCRGESGKTRADSLWPWSPGKTPDISPFQEKFSLKGAVISAVDLVKGIGRLASMTVIDVVGATGLPDTNYEGKSAAAVNALLDHDLVYVHVEGPDEAGHAGDPELKKQAIEYCSKRLIGNAISRLEKNGLLSRTRIAVLPDHFTPCKSRTHSAEPVPFLAWGAGIKPDTTCFFTEKESSAGGLGLREGIEFLPFFLEK